MTKRDNFFAFFQGKEYDHIPILSEDVLSFQPRELHDYVARGFVSDAFPFDRDHASGGKGWFGVEWEYEPSAGGSIDKGRTFDDITEWKDKVVFPDLDAVDWEGIKKKNEEFLKTDKIIACTIFSGFFERTIAFMDFQDAAMALAMAGADPDYEEAVKGLYDKLSDLYCDYIERMHKYFNVEFVELHDDWGTQKSSMMSPDAHKEFLMPYVKKVIDKCHSLGMLFMMHSCGNITSVFDNLVDAGCNTWFGQETVGIKETIVKKYDGRFICGVSIEPTDLSSMEAVRAYAQNEINKYKNYKVWYRVPKKGVTPEQTAEIIKMIQESK
ncbi:MAG: hypothetical protein MJ148_03755 [Clostridia bacterium]|nr:hypothetical protein [Clostridia bacterium]